MGRKPKPTNVTPIGEAKKKGRPPKAKKDAIPPAGDGRPLVATDNNERDAIRANFLSHRVKWKAWKAKVAELEEVEKNLKSALKNDGFRVKQFEIADALQKGPKSNSKIIMEVSDRLQVAQWIGDPLGKQMDLFAQPDRTPSVETAADRGKQDSMEGKTANPPYHQASPQYQDYMTAFHDETERRTLAGLKPTEPKGDFEDDQTGDEGNPVAEVGPDPARPLSDFH